MEDGRGPSGFSQQARRPSRALSPSSWQTGHGNDSGSRSRRQGLLLLLLDGPRATAQRDVQLVIDSSRQSPALGGKDRRNICRHTLPPSWQSSSIRHHHTYHHTSEVYTMASGGLLMTHGFTCFGGSGDRVFCSIGSKAAKAWRCSRAKQVPPLRQHAAESKLDCVGDPHQLQILREPTWQRVARSTDLKHWPRPLPTRAG